MATYKAKKNVGNAVPFWVSDLIGKENHQKLIQRKSVEIDNVPKSSLEFIEVTDSKPTSSNTVSEIKAYMDVNNISYASDDNKSELLAKL